MTNTVLNTGVNMVTKISNRFFPPEASACLGSELYIKCNSYKEKNVVVIEGLNLFWALWGLLKEIIFTMIRERASSQPWVEGKNFLDSKILWKSLKAKKEHGRCEEESKDLVIGT